MHRRRTLLFALAFTSGSCTGSKLSTRMLADDPYLARLTWLSGVWLAIDGAMRVEEYWSLPAGGTMLGMVRAIDAGHTVYSEYLRIETSARGPVYFTLQSDGATHAQRWETIREGAQTIAFQSQVDAPVTITYARERDRLFVELEGAQTGRWVARRALLPVWQPAPAIIP